MNENNISAEKRFSLATMQLPEDLKKLNIEQCQQLCKEIRSVLIQTVSKNGGHLASNLGVVELTVAMHRVFDSPQDKFVWDVGHQCYTHKILTGRYAQFSTLRKENGISGFPKPEESPHDTFISGHSSTAISVASGVAEAMRQNGDPHHVIAVLGDGAMTGGLAFEGLNNAGKSKNRLIIILNDNAMSISKNVGSVAKYLANIRNSENYVKTKKAVERKLQKTPVIGAPVAKMIKSSKDALRDTVFRSATIFEDFGFVYLGPVDGHNLEDLEEVLQAAKAYECPVFVHIHTKKGKGYLPSEKNPGEFHGISRFNVETGNPEISGKDTYSDIFGKELVRLAKKDASICAITAAMEHGTGLQYFSRAYPQRYYDVGIAEQHAVTFAAALASQGKLPVFAVYSSFLQRAYDQILHDVCIQNLPVVFAIDRAGLVGSDGETHQGIFDISYLSSIPNMTIMAPKNKWELSDMIKYAVNFGTPVAVRYPRGEAYDGLKEYRAPISIGKCEWIYRESGIALFALGSMVKTAVAVRDALKAEGYPCSIINARFAKPLDEDALRYITEHHKVIVTMEENVISGGFGEHVTEFYNNENCKDIRIVNIAIPDEYVEHGNVELLRKEVGLDADTIIARTIEAYQNVTE